MSKKRIDQPIELSDAELLRYSRHILLPDFDIAGQQALRNARVLLMGVGGLGSPVCLYLAAAGVGELVLVDDDQVELSNLQRQIVHSTDAIGNDKVASAKNTLSHLNPEVHIECHAIRPNEQEIAALVADCDLVIDATDNFSTRFAINAACWQHKKPLVSGAAIRWEGQVAVFDPRQANTPCYQCLYGTGDDNAMNCAENGILSPVVGIIGTCQALEAIKVISGVGESLIGSVLYFDAKYMEWRKFKLPKDPNCPNCKA